MRIEHAELSLVGDREDNQDRVTVAATEQAAFLIVIDGMGGHSDGSRAADTALKSLLDSFQQTPQPIFDPLGFLHTQERTWVHVDVHLQQIECPDWPDEQTKWWPTNAMQGDIAYWNMLFELTTDP